MIEIWTKSAKFDSSQRLADLAGLILKKGSLSDLERQEECDQINQEKHNQRELPKSIKTQNIEN